MIRVVLPYHLQTLARVSREIQLPVSVPVTMGAVVDALEAQYPVLGGTIRGHGRGPRRPFIRFFACGQDFSMDGWDVLLPEEVVSGTQPLRIVGAMAGG